MRKLLVILVIGFLLIPIASYAQLKNVHWPSFQRDKYNSGNAGTGIPYLETPSVVWSYPVGAVKGENQSQPIIDETEGTNGVVIVGSNTGYMYKINRATGTCIWTSEQLDDSIQHAPALNTDGNIYVGTGFEACVDNKFCKIKGTDGSVIWSIPYGAVGANYHSLASPVIDVSGNIYWATSGPGVPHASNCFWSADSNGNIRWSSGVTYPGGGAGGSPALSSDETVVYYTSSEDWKIWAISTSTGAINWSYQAGGWFWGAGPCVGPDGTIYAGNAEEQKVYAMNPNGTLKWALPLGGGWINSNFSYRTYGGKTRLYVMTNGIGALNPYVLAIDDSGASGSLVWSYALTDGGWGYTDTHCTDDGLIYVSGQGDGKFHCLYDAATSPTYLWGLTGVISKDGVSSTRGISIDSDGAIYVNSCDGYLYKVYGTPGTALKIVPQTLPDGYTGIPYSAFVSVIGGTPPYTWSITSGSLPPGWNLNWITGEISGITSASGDYTFEVTATDSTPVTPQTDKKTYQITVHGVTITTESPLPDGKIDEAYSVTIQAFGGYTPYNWSIPAGGQPSGLDINTATGEISGTPTDAGTYMFTVKVTDNIADTDEKAFQLTIKAQPLEITTYSYHNGKVGEPYPTIVFRSRGGYGAMTWSASAGLPPGMTFNNATQALSGTPSAVGVYTFSILVQDSQSPPDIGVDNVEIEIRDISPWRLCADDPSLWPYVDADPPPSWSTDPWACNDLSVSSGNGKIYACGGHGPRNYTDNDPDGPKLYLAEKQSHHSIYDPATDTWRSAYRPYWAGEDIPTGYNNANGTAGPTVEQGTGTGNNQAFCYDWDNDGTKEEFVLAGCSISDGYFAVYDPDTNGWSKTADRPDHSGGGRKDTHDATALENKDIVYVYGGYSNGPDEDTFWIYDIAADEWSEQPDGPLKMTDHCGEIVDDKMYLISGWQKAPGEPDGTTFDTDVITYDIQTKSWGTATSIPTGLQHAASVAWAKRIYVIGGQVASSGPTVRDEETDYTDIIQEYNTLTDTWATLTTKLPERICRQGSTIVDDVLYVVGGEAWNKNESRFENKTDVWAISMYDLTGINRPDFYDITYDYATDSVTLYWTGEAGVPYAIKYADGEYDDSLVWSVAVEVAGVAGPMSWTDTGGPTDSGRYYVVTVAGGSDPGPVGGVWRLRLRNSSVTGQNEVCMPLLPVPAQPYPNAVIGAQGLTASVHQAFSDKLWHWNSTTQSWDKAYLDQTTGWTVYDGSAFNINMGEGYQLLLVPSTPDGLRVGLVGWVNKVKPYPVPIAPVTVLSFVSWPYARSVALNPDPPDNTGLRASGFTGHSFYAFSDKLWFWNFAFRSYDKIWYDPVAGKWLDYYKDGAIVSPATPTTKKLRAGEGFWIITVPTSSLPPIWNADP